MANEKRTSRVKAKWTITVEVADCWIADGFNPDQSMWEGLIRSAILGYATPDEVSVRLTSAPSDGTLEAITARYLKACGEA